jgi:hypothetical protein
MSQLRLAQPQNLRSLQLQLVQPRVKRQPAATALIVSGIGLLVIVILELLITIATSQGVYQISGLKAEKKNLVESTQILGAEVDSLSSPQNLSNAAAQLGMVANANPVFLNVEKQKIAGKPMAALAGYDSRISKNLVANAELDTKTSAAALELSQENSKPSVDAQAAQKTVNSNVATQAVASPEVVSTKSRIPASPTN